MERHYKEFPISSVAVPDRGNASRAIGIIVNPYTALELKRFEARDLLFARKEEAEACALQLCKDWIDESEGEP